MGTKIILTLILIANKIHDFGFDLNWKDKNFEFVTFADHGIFNITNAGYDHHNTKILISAMNTDNRELNIEQKFMDLEFQWKDKISPKVDFTINNVTARNGKSVKIPIIINVVPYKSEASIINFEWNILE